MAEKKGGTKKKQRPNGTVKRIRTKAPKVRRSVAPLVENCIICDKYLVKFRERERALCDLCLKAGVRGQ